MGGHIALGSAQGVGLSLAAPFGYGFGEVGEQHGKPQDDGDGQNEAGMRVGDADKGQHEQDGREDG